MNNYFLALAKVAADLAGYPVHPVWIYAQWAHETNGFTSDLCVNYHNLGGLTQVSPNNLPQPDGEYYYRHFESYEACAQYFGRYLRLYHVDGICNAYTLEEYLAALKHGGYFGDTLENYLAGCRRWLATIQ